MHLDLGINQKTMGRVYTKLNQEYRQTSVSRLFSLQKIKSQKRIDSCMHFYRRDLTPVREAFAISSSKASPYTQNFFEADLASDVFKTKLLKAIGVSAICVKSHCNNSNQVLQTFYKQEISPSVDQFKPIPQPI
jgi:hypothetical protein